MTLGQLALLTPENTLAAAAEIKTGIRISLNLPLDEPRFPISGRRCLHRREIALEADRVFDDELLLNTQSSSQWDGFKHFAGKDGLFYGNSRPSDRDFSQKLGIHNWCKEGIVGRGVLLDVWRYNEGSYNPLDGEAISLETMKNCISLASIRLRKGDILCIRYGFIQALSKLTNSEAETYSKRKVDAWAGLEQSHEVLQWFREMKFSAVIADNPSFEVFPSRADFLLHEHFLPKMGLPIGELFDLERLSVELHRQGRSSFFLTSEPLAIPGGVASPPQALAIL